MKKLKIRFKYCTIAIVPFLLSFLLFHKKHVTVYLIGDSTMCVYQPGKSHLTGWGMPFANFFDSTVTIKNKAEGGESTRTFIEEKLWKPVSDSLKPGDYLLIQFGHNDEVPSKESYTTEKDFRANLIRFITEARSKRANPVLITPVARRKFDDSGNVQDVHITYSALVRNVAAEYKVPLIDLNKKSQYLLQELGPEKSKSLFLALGENPYYPPGQEDITHFNELGARKIAEIVIAEIKALKIELADRIVKSHDVNIQEKSYSENIPEAKLKVATCQFPVSGDVHKNAQFIKNFIKEAAIQKADIVHFSEASLTGYPPFDIPSFDYYDWNALSKETKEIMALAKEFNIWVVLGSAHYLDFNVKPTNCLYIISNKGEIVDRYDKSMLTDGDKSDVDFYSPGNHTTIININGFKCGFLICYDSCFPEMYNILRHKGVKIVFHSFYNAHHPGRTILDDIIPAEIRVRASDNLMWIIANNSTGNYSSWPACIARPDGSIETLQRGMPGILYREFPDKEIMHDFPSWTHNNKIMQLSEQEVYHNGIPSNCPRALDTKSLPYQHTR